MDGALAGKPVLSLKAGHSQQCIPMCVKVPFPRRSLEPAASIGRAQLCDFRDARRS